MHESVLNYVNEILNFLKSYGISIDDDDAQIFNKNIMDFTHFTCDGFDSFYYVNYFDFLNNHQFHYLSLINIQNFRIRYENCKVSSKNFILEKINCPGIDYDEDDYDDDNNNYDNSDDIKEELINIDNLCKFLTYNLSVSQSIKIKKYARNNFTFFHWEILLQTC